MYYFISCLVAVLCNQQQVICASYLATWFVLALALNGDLCMVILTAAKAYVIFTPIARVEK